MQETDQLTYRRGLIASLVGLGIQVLLFIAVALFGNRFDSGREGDPVAFAQPLARFGERPPLRSTYIR